MSAPQKVEHTTAMALQEKSHLKKSLRRFDMLFFTLCALVGLDTLGQVSGFGAQTFAWLVILAVAFVLPYALLMSELGSAFTQEGGPYEWMKLSFNRFWAGLGSVLYWVTNPLWVGGSLAFIATDAWSNNFHTIGTGFTFGNIAFKTVFIWVSIIVAIASLQRGKWIPNVGAIVRMGVLAFFSITVLIYGIKHGVHGFSAGDFKPSSLVVFFGLVPLLLFNYVGFELQNGAAEEMQNPQHDVPVTVLQSAVLGVLAYSIPVFGILAVLPATAVTGIGGFLDAVHTTFGVYGHTMGNVLTDAMVLGFIFALVTSGSVWMMGSDRILAVAAYDGAFPGYFGRFHPRLGTPVRVNVMSGIASTVFMLSAVWLLSGGASAANQFTIVLYLATSTTLLSYLLIFPCGVIMRRKFADVHRPYRVPFGEAGMWVCASVCVVWMVLGSWVALFPGTLESWTGHSYSIVDSYGVSRVRFETLTLGTLLVIVIISVVGYVLAADVRAQQVEVPLESGIEPAVGD